MFFRWLKRLFLGIVLIITAGFLLPESPQNPVKGATKADWNPDSFWHYPWGKSIVHKGIDIFAKKGTPIEAPTYGVVYSVGKWGRGGNVVLMIGPKWRVHYFAHLSEINTQKWAWVNKGDLIGKVGDSGNAAGKPPHLHYTLGTLIPYPWRADDSPQGRLKMFFLDPEDWMTTPGS